MDNKNLTWAEAGNEFLANVSMVGARYLVQREVFKFRWILWLIFLLAGVALMLYQGYDRVAYYAAYPTMTVLKREARDVLDFPVITICNANPIKKSYFYKKETKDILTTLWRDHDNPSSLGPDFETAIMPNLTDTPFSDWDEVLKFVAHKKEDMVSEFEECGWLQNRQGVNCSINTFSDTVTDFSGSCIQFNAGNDSLKATRSGTGWGFNVLLETQYSTEYTVIGEVEGFKVLIHHKDAIPEVRAQGLWIRPGHSTEIGITLQTTKRTPWPYSNCTNGKDITLKYYDKYSQSRCNRECLTDYIVEKCGCRLYWMPGNATSCDLKQSEQCGEHYEYVYIAAGLVRQCNCKPDCETHNYITSASAASIGTHWAIAIAINADELGVPIPMLATYIRTNMVRLEVFFKTMTEDVIVIKPAYTVVALLSDLGGALGLALGCTFLTVIELLDFILTTIMRKKKQKCK